MASKTIISSLEAWENCANIWKNYSDGHYNAMNEIDKVKALLNKVGDIGKVNIDLDYEDIDRVESELDALCSYCLDIHSEIYAKIDELFFMQMQGFSDITYMLNPNKYTLNSENSCTARNISINDLISEAPIDAFLRSDYLNQIKELSEDVPSDDAKKAYRDDLWQWHTQMTFDDIKEIDRIIYMSGGPIEAPGGTIIAEDNPMSEIFYEMSPYLVIKTNDTQETDYYASWNSGISYNLENDRTNERGAYVTFFHEMGHMIDNTLPEVIEGQYTSSWHISFVSTNYSSYTDEFYNNIIGDVNYYRYNYNTIHGTNLTQKEIDQKIQIELEISKSNEASDLFGGVTDNQVVGTYAHQDEEIKIFGKTFTNSYWNYNDKTGKPAKKILNKEAFAHFTEISMVQNSGDIRDLQKYFPNAYETYNKMIKEMKEKLDESRV